MIFFGINWKLKPYSIVIVNIRVVVQLKMKTKNFENVALSHFSSNIETPKIQNIAPVSIEINLIQTHLQESLAKKFTQHNIYEYLVLVEMFNIRKCTSYDPTSFYCTCLGKWYMFAVSDF